MEERVIEERAFASAPAAAQLIAQQFGIRPADIRTYSPLTLAFLGDNVFDLVIRTILVQQGNRSVNVLHRQKSRLVKAAAQAVMAEYLEEVFTDEEEAVYKRGRNAKSVTMPKHARASDYRKATGLEALMGYLYLQGRSDRILELIREGMASLEDAPQDKGAGRQPGEKE